MTGESQRRGQAPRHIGCKARARQHGALRVGRHFLDDVAEELACILLDAFRTDDDGNVGTEMPRQFAHHATHVLRRHDGQHCVASCSLR